MATNKLNLSLFVIAFFLVSGCASSKVDNRLKPEMTFVKGGTFQYGDFYENSNTDAIPVHEVTVEDFYIGTFEVTFDEYDDFAKREGYALPDDEGNGRGNRGVVFVSWHEAVDFCAQFGYRLPAEWEWEYAARDRGRDFVLPGTRDLDSLQYLAFTSIDDIYHTLPVGQKMPNKLGLYDMSGNAFEWIGEFYQIFARREDFRPGMKRDGVRIIRGGSFREDIDATRTYWRAGTLAEVRSDDIGFRCAVSAEDYKK